MAIINSENTDSCFIRTIYDIVPIPINRDLYSHIELYRSIIIYRDRRIVPEFADTRTRNIFYVY